MKVKKVSKPALHADTYSVACVVNNNAEVLEGALNRIKALEQETFMDAYIKQVVKERDIAIGQLNELGYSFGEKIRPCDKKSKDEKCGGCYYNDGEVHAKCVVCEKVAGEDAKEKVIAEIDRQGEWLAEAGYNAYNVGIAFESIKRALRK